MAEKSDSEGFAASRLGTQEHWQSQYETELRSFDESGLEGEIWFGIDAEEDMVDWALEHIPIDSQPRVLDVGTGNAHLLCAFAEAGYSPSLMTGIDYAAAAVSLGEAICKKKSFPEIVLRQCDIMNEDVEPPSGADGWDLVLDKGTYDAIALHEDRSLHARFPERVSTSVRPGGIFLITSCNFTETELRDAFEGTGRFAFHSKVARPQFTFGGKTGSTIATVAFIRPA